MRIACISCSARSSSKVEAQTAFASGPSVPLKRYSLKRMVLLEWHAWVWARISDRAAAEAREKLRSAISLFRQTLRTRTFRTWHENVLLILREKAMLRRALAHFSRKTLLNSISVLSAHALTASRSVAESQLCLFFVLRTLR